MIWPPPRPQPPDDSPDYEPLTGWLIEGPEVHETDNPVIGTLYGPDGSVLIELRERRTVRFGYQRGDWP